MTDEQLPRAARRLLLGTGLDAIGNGFTLPFLVIYLHEIRHLTLAAAGVVIAAQAATGLVATPLVGALVDRWGPRPVLLASLLCSGIGGLALAGASNLVEALMAMVACGAGGAGYWPSSQSLIAELVPSARRSQWYGVNFAILNLGIGLGGVAAALFVRSGHPGTYQLLFVIDAASFLADLAVIGGLRVPRPVAHDRRTRAAGEGYRRLFANRALARTLLLQLGFILLGYAQLEAGFPPFVRSLGVSPRVVGIAFAANTAMIVLAQLPVQRRTAAIRRTRSLLAVCAIWGGSWALLGCARLVPAGAGRSVITIAFCVLFGAGETFFSTALAPLINDLAPDHLRGRANAASSWGWAAANVVGPVLAAGLIGAGAAIVWLALLVVGLAAVAVLALDVERRVPPASNRPEPQEPVVGSAEPLAVLAPPS